ncbi:MAG TPA: hypothetical protein PKD41_15605, partial [Solidesulfovibrio sp.]|nr:hypothetical protein [Solidesulfovibrio sp.]
MPQSIAPAILHVDLATAGMRRVAASPRLSRGEGGRALSTALCDADSARRVAWDDADAPLCL